MKYPNINKNIPVTMPPVRKRNRGGHLNSTNPKYNNAFKKHNELKMLSQV